MNSWKLIVVVAVFFGICSCANDLEGNFNIFQYSATFDNNEENWSADFADYPAGGDDSTVFELEAGMADLPSNVGSRQAFRLSGNNLCNDLFMFIKHKISGLNPNQEYTVAFEIEMASDGSETYQGDYGSSGRNVYLKAGASPVEPRKVIDGDFYRMNIDKGNHASGGVAMSLIGDISTGQNTATYSLINRSNSFGNARFTAKTNSRGELWLIVGTDSDFRGVTSVYYTAINVVLSESN